MANARFLVSETTINQNALSVLARAIETLVSDLGDVDWHNRLVFLHRSVEAQ